MITITMEVTPEQVLKIAEVLRSSSAETAPVNPAPVNPVPAAVSAPAPAAAPIVAPSTAVPAAPVVPVQPVSAPAAVPAAAPRPISQPTPQQVPTAVKEYTADELSLAARPIAEAGRQAELLDLLHSFTFTDSSGVTKNVQSIRELPKELYPAFANGIRALGGNI